jgi:hypothetical protein
VKAGYELVSRHMSKAMPGDYVSFDGVTAEKVRSIEVARDRVIFTTWDGRGVKWIARGQRVAVYRARKNGSTNG